HLALAPELRSPLHIFLVERSAHHRDPPSFPTRRSSDLAPVPSPTSSSAPCRRSSSASRAPRPCGTWPTAPTRTTCGTSCWRSSRDRKSTRLNSSHVKISYAVFCLKKKIINKKVKTIRQA